MRRPVVPTGLVGIILAWFYANTRGSVLAVMVGHTLFNWSNYVFPTLGIDTAAELLFVAYFVVILYILFRYGYKTFTRAVP